LIARAPGKLMLSGAYAVLYGAPTLVAAVDRYAHANAAARGAPLSAEARAFYGSETAPVVDVGEMYTGGQKLGLGSSAAALVASLAADRALRGEDVESRPVRDLLFADARRAHHTAQSGGSGADVAASVHGGTVRYRIDGADAGKTLELSPVEMPVALTIVPFWTGSSARTSDLVGRVVALVTNDRGAHRDLMVPLSEVAEQAARVFSAGDACGFVSASRAAHRGLVALGTASATPIVPPAVDELSRLAEGDGAAFVVSGAGGGDIALHLSVRASGGTHPSGPSVEFFRAAARAGLAPLSLTFAARGVHVSDSPAVSSAPAALRPS
jgi:phosphomevalonate kinase